MREPRRSSTCVPRFPIGVMSKAFGKTSSLVQFTYLILALEFGEDWERFMLGFSNLK